MNRQQRRAQQRATPGYLRGTKEQKIKALLQNGITLEDLEEEYKRGYEAGARDAMTYTYKAVYAAVVLALRKLYRFGSLRASRVLTEVDHNVAHCLTTQELIDEVWEKVGLRLNFEEPANRIELTKRRAK